MVRGSQKSRLRTVTAFAAGIGLVSPSLAYAAETPVTVAEPVTVTGTRIDDSASRYLIGVKVITAKDIERSRASTLPELLRSSPNIPTRDLAGSPNEQIDLRGFGSWGDQNTLVLLDGMRVREYEQLTVNWAAIPLDSIERIEILPPNSAVIYGSGATGGAINIITKAPKSDSRSGYAGAGVASYDTQNAQAGVNVAGDKASLRVAGSHFQTDNFRDNNDVRINSAQGTMRWTGESSSLAMNFGGDSQYNGLPGPISEAQIAVNPRQALTPNDFATQNGGYVTLGARSALGTSDLAVNVGYRTRDTGSSFLVGTPFRNNVDTQVELWTFAPRLWMRPGFTAWDSDLIIGADFENWTFDATGGPTIVTQPHSTQKNTGVYAQYTMQFPTKATVALGAREQRARYDVTDVANPVSQGSRKETLSAWDISLRQALTPKFSVYAKVGSNFRLPNVNDNFNPVTAMVTLLNPQTAHDIQVGFEGGRETLTYGAAVYRADIDNEIFFNPVTLGSANRQPTRRQGVQVEAKWQAKPFLGLYINYIYADATFREGVINGISIAGNRVPLSPRYTLNAGLEWSFMDKARADLHVRWVGSSVFDNDQTNTFGSDIPAYTVADLKVSVRSGKWLINAGVRNLFDEQYFSYGVVTGMPTYSAFPQPERTVFASGQYAFH